MQASSARTHTCGSPTRARPEHKPRVALGGSPSPSPLPLATPGPREEVRFRGQAAPSALCSGPRRQLGSSRAMGCMTSAPAVPRSAPVTAATGSGFRRHDRGTVDAFSGAVEAPRPLFDPVAGVDDMPPLDPSHLGLAHLFQQTALLRMFMAFAASRCAEENVLFLRDVKEWERSLRGDKGADGKGARASAKFMVSAPKGFRAGRALHDCSLPLTLRAGGSTPCIGECAKRASRSGR